MSFANLRCTTCALLSMLSITCIAQIDELPSYLRAICQADIDGDELIDLVALDAQGGLLYHLNEGNNTYAAAVHITSNGLTEFVGVQVIDLDGDEDMDIVRNDQHTVLSYLNDGNANFSSSFNDNVFVSDYLDSQFMMNDVCISYAPLVTDRNNDDVLDLTWPLGMCTFNEFLQMNTYETICLTIYGEPEGGFGPLHQMSFVTPPVDISTPDVLIHSRMVDTDANGTEEIIFQFVTQSFPSLGGITQTYSSGQWYPEFGFYTELEPRQFRSADVDTDGDMDIIIHEGHSNANFNVHLNDGNGLFDEGTSVLSGNGFLDFDMADFDQDRDMDYFVIKGGELIRYAQLNPGEFQAQVISPDTAPDYINIELLRNEQNEAVAILAIASTLSHVYALAPCAGDISGDGSVGIEDFLAFNSSFGTTCTGCPADLNGDGIVDIADFLILNSSFGVTCP